MSRCLIKYPFQANAFVLFFFFISVPPETTGLAPHRSTSEEELTGAEKRMVGGKGTLREKREERDGKRGVMGRVK